MKTLVFAGAGLASLSLAMRLIHEDQPEPFRLVLLERSDKTKNDRTWCFWEQSSGYFEELVYCRWKKLDFFSHHFSGPLSMGGYEYKMIRGIDFYQYCLERLRSHPRVEWISGAVRQMEARDGSVWVELEDGSTRVWEQAMGFNSIPAPRVRQAGDIVLLQHFKGWRIRTEKPVFEAGRATLMDFRISQEPGTSFVYVLPLSTTEALVEYTLFTDALLPPDAYDEMLDRYCRGTLQLTQFEVLEEEFGIIPMTNLNYPASIKGIIQLGTAGGQTKASSGYTFQFVQKQSDALARSLAAGQWPPKTGTVPWRFRFYDHTLLYVLHEKSLPGSRVFAQLFQRNPADRVLRFLDNETSPGQELKILASLPTMPFLKAAIRKRRTY